MATYFFGINDGGNEGTVTDGASTTAKDIEIAINTTANVPNINDLLLGIENIQRYILKRGKVW